MKAFFYFFVIFLTVEYGFCVDPISEAMCRDPNSFQSCYQVGKDQCLEWADQAVQACIGRMPPRPVPPASIDDLPHSEFGQWNLSLGHCSEQTFENDHQDKFTSTPQCSNLLSARIDNRKSMQSQMTSRFRPRTKISNYQALFMSVPPLFIGILAAFLFLRRRARVGKLTGLYGFLSWILFLFSAFFGEIVSHIIFPFLYVGIGDSPAQMGGLFMVMFLSPLLNLMIWFYFRYKSRHLKSALSDLGKK